MDRKTTKEWKGKEKRDAKSFKARQMPRSGGLWFAPGDESNENFLIDSKKSKHERFSITVKMWKKIAREALLSHRIPILSPEFGKDNIELVILDKNDFISLLESKNGTNS